MTNRTTFSLLSVTLHRKNFFSSLLILVTWLHPSLSWSHEPKTESKTELRFDARGFRSALIAEFEAAAGRSEPAFQHYLELAIRTPNDVYFDRAVSAALKGRSAQNALHGALTWTKTMPQSVGAQDRLVMIMLALDKIEEIDAPMARLLDIVPNAERAKTIDRISNAIRRTNKRTQTRITLQEVLKPYLHQADTTEAAQRALAWVEWRDQRYDQAFSLVSELIKQGHLHTDIGLILVGLTEQNMPQAQERLLDFLKQQNAPQVRLAYAQWLIKQQQDSAALKQLALVTQTAPDLDTAWLIKGGLEFESGQYEPSRHSLEQFIRLSRKSNQSTKSLSQAYLMLAQMAMQDQRPEQADAWLAKIDDASMHWQAQQLRAKIKRQTKGLDEALSWVAELPAPSKTEEKNKLILQAQLLKSEQAHERVAELFRKAIAIEANDADLMYELALIVEKLKQWEEFETLLKRVMEIKPESAHAYNALGYSLADRNIRLDEAKELILKALKLSPDDAFILDSLAWVEYRMGHTQIAYELLTKAFEQQADPEIAAHLGEVLWSMGKKSEAQQIWDDALKNHPDHPVLKAIIDRFVNAK